MGFFKSLAKAAKAPLKLAHPNPKKAFAAVKQSVQHPVQFALGKKKKAPAPAAAKPMM